MDTCPVGAWYFEYDIIITIFAGQMLQASTYLSEFCLLHGSLHALIVHNYV